MLFLIQISIILLICLLLVKFINFKNPNLSKNIIVGSYALSLFIPAINYFDLNIKWSYLLSNSAFDSEYVETWNGFYSEVKHDNSQIEITTHDQTEESSPQILNSTEFSFFKWFMIFWITGMLLKLLFKLHGVFKLYQIIKSANEVERKQIPFELSSNTKLLSSSSTQVPFVLVLRKILIVIPKSQHMWPQASLAEVIAHELQHVARKDHHLIIFSSIVSVIYWFHPLIYLLNKQLKQNIEIGCDNDLIAAGMDRYSYAETLITVAADTPSNEFTLQMSSHPKFLKQRISYLLNSSYSLSQIHYLILSASMLITALIGLLANNEKFDYEITDFVNFETHDLQSIRDGKLSPNSFHVAAFYDGISTGDTYLDIEVIQNNHKRWIKLGPLKKFDEQIYTWSFKLLENSYLSGNIAVSGIVADGMVDGIAVGLLISDDEGEIQLHKSNGLLTNKTPNVVCAWPLGFDDDTFYLSLPQLTSHRPESAKRLLCGAQLLQNGSYSLF